MTAERVTLPVPEEVLRIAHRLQSAGHEAWAVGGGVRDALAGGVPGDWDMTTSARPDQVRAAFKRTVPVGIEHGTIGVLGGDGKLYEVTTFRRDVETDGRHARVIFADTLEEDLDRRDFTINAVAWNPASGELRDPHGGVEDLRRGVLRTVGSAEGRFTEDRLRVLRALRFAGRFGLTVDPETWAAIQASAPRLGHLSAERIREELYKVLAGRTPPSRALELYESSGVLAHLYPEMQACVGVTDPADGGDVWRHLLATTDAIAPTRLVLRLAGLLHDLGKSASGIAEDRFPGHAQAGAALARGLLSRLKASNADIDRVVHLVAQHADLPIGGAPDPEVRRWLRRVGRAHLRDLVRLRAAACRARRGGEEDLADRIRAVRSVLARGPALEINDLAIGGAELRGLGLRPGPRFGEILRDLLEAVTDDPALNTKERLSEMAAEFAR